MHPWTRPAAHSTFAAEAATLLADLRRDVASNNGRAKTSHFDRRALWTYSWGPKSPTQGIHKHTLVGDAWSRAKCVWCEQLRERKRELDVEHYRPKVCVTEWQETPQLIANEPPQERNERGGYWWLAFAWNNFALSCKTCNQGWKRNLFPVRASRSADVKEGDETRDAPLLLDPSVPFRVADHFRWTPGGIIEPVSDQGFATIVTCGLNRRDLLERRAQVAQNVLDHRGELIKALRGDRADRPEVLRREKRALAALGSITAEFTGMVRWLVEEGLKRSWSDLGFDP